MLNPDDQSLEVCPQLFGMRSNICFWKELSPFQRAAVAKRKKFCFTEALYRDQYISRRDLSYLFVKKH